MPLDYLLKTEPSAYSFADLQRDQVTTWDGVTNPTAVKHLREMQPGARLVIYETGGRSLAVGTATVVSVNATRSQEAGGEDQGWQAARQARLAGSKSKPTSYSRNRRW